MSPTGERKKILLCVNSDIGRKNTIGFRFGKIAQELKNQGIDFNIIARANYSDFDVQAPFYGNYLSRFLNAVRIYFLPFLDYRGLEIWLFDGFVLSVLKKSKNNFDAAHFGECLPKSIEFLKSQGVRILLDMPIAHYDYAVYLQVKGFKLDNRINLKAPDFLNKSIELADVIIAPSLFVKRSIEMAGFNNKRIEIAPFGADTPKNFNKNDIESRAKTKPLKFIFVGNVNYRKGVNFLLEAWGKANLKDAELLICGRIYKSIKREIKKYENRNIKFLGFVDVDKYLRESHIFTFPTLFEGSAKAVYEAMSYGLPVITTTNAGSIVKNGETGFIVPIGDADALVSMMIYFYQNIGKMVEMGKNAFNEVKKYSWGDYAKNVIKNYKIR